MANRKPKGEKIIYLSTVVELSTGERRWVLLQKVFHSNGLIVRHGQEVTEPATTEDDLFASALGVVDRRTGVDLSRSYGSKETTSGGEPGVEYCSIGILSA